MPEPTAGTPLRGRVLVIDDEDGILRVLTRVLRSHELVTVRDGQEAMDVLESSDSDFDLLLCDVSMPRMGGVRFWTELRSKHPELLPRTVFMTGGFLCAADEDFFAAHGPKVFDKPFAIQELRELVRGFVASVTS
jgi:CheY-like chemotaxis protein